MSVFVFLLYYTEANVYRTASHFPWRSHWQPETTIAIWLACRIWDFIKPAWQKSERDRRQTSAQIAGGSDEGASLILTSLPFYGLPQSQARLHQKTLTEIAVWPIRTRLTGCNGFDLPTKSKQTSEYNNCGTRTLLKYKYGFFTLVRSISLFSSLVTELLWNDTRYYMLIR